MERDKIVQQCEGVVVACWGHYADEGLSGEERERVLAALREALPASVTTEAWDKRSARYTAYVEAEAITEERSVRKEPLDFAPGELDVSR